jgi:acyl phosphate:glycerol-3-phosphate acyltransferase
VENLPEILLLILSYLIGSIPTAVWISKFIYGADVRTFGSGNAGSTNMFRTFGFKAGISTQLIDVIKGVLAALLPWLAFQAGVKDLKWWGLELPIPAMLCGLAAVAGHIYPILAGFRGGKGINTLLGMMIVIYPLGAGVSLAVFGLLLLTTRMVSVGSLGGTLAFPLFAILMKFPSCLSINWTVAGLGFLMFGIVAFTHRTNISRILKGTENRIK